MRIREICCTYLVLKCVKSKSTSNGKWVSYIEDKGKLLAHEHLAFFHAPARLESTWQAGKEQQASVPLSLETSHSKVLDGMRFSSEDPGQRRPAVTCDNLPPEKTVH